MHITEEQYKDVVICPKTKDCDCENCHHRKPHKKCKPAMKGLRSACESTCQAQGIHVECVPVFEVCELVWVQTPMWRIK